MKIEWSSSSMEFFQGILGTSLHSGFPIVEINDCRASLGTCRVDFLTNVRLPSPSNVRASFLEALPVVSCLMSGGAGLLLPSLFDEFVKACH